jgi:hypothetical protein
MQATTTQVAAEMFGTQTALVPTATPTITPTPTETFTPIPTTTFTSTPHPPTATLTAAGVEKLMLCYKVAVSIEADWEVHLLISGTGNLFDGWYNPDNQWKSQDEISQELNAFWWERSHRVGGFKIERVDKLVNPLSSTTITVDGVVLSENEFGRPDCDHYFNEIIIADAKIQINPKGGVMNRISEVSYAKKIINKVVKKMRTELIEVYGVDPAELDAIEDPIWQFMRNLYGEPLNKIPIMRKRTEP